MKSLLSESFNLKLKKIQFSNFFFEYFSILSNWYNEKPVWSNAKDNMRIIQLLYNLNDVNFEIISKNNFELDTSWPCLQLNRHNNMNINLNNSIAMSQYDLKDRASSVSCYSISIDQV
jgi:hypothetical protein